MSAETKPLLKSSSDDYHSQSRGRSTRPVNQNYVQGVENLLKQSWTKAVKVARLREFFAEFLATFALVVGSRSC